MYSQGWPEPYIYGVHTVLFAEISSNIRSYTASIYGAICRDFIKYTVIYGVYKRFWPTLRIVYGTSWNLDVTHGVGVYMLRVIPSGGLARTI
jgi:hypothetical protein